MFIAQLSGAVHEERLRLDREGNAAVQLRDDGVKEIVLGENDFIPANQVEGVPDGVRVVHEDRGAY